MHVYIKIMREKCDELFVNLLARCFRAEDSLVGERREQQLVATHCNEFNIYTNTYVYIEI